MAGDDLDRSHLAGQRRRVEDGALGAQPPVGRHHLTGLDEEVVPDLDRIDLDVRERAVRTAQVSDPRCALEQRREFTACPLRGVRLERLPAHEHRGDDRPGQQLTEQQRTDHGEQRDHVDAEVAARERSYRAHRRRHEGEQRRDDQGRVGGDRRADRPGQSGGDEPRDDRQQLHPPEPPGVRHDRPPRHRTTTQGGGRRRSSAGPEVPARRRLSAG
jgi:hypothetical protein